MQGGDFNDSSDIDIMILTDLTDEEIVEYRSKIINYAWELAYNNEFKIDISPKVRNIEKYNKRIDVVPFYMNIHKEGVKLYG